MILFSLVGLGGTALMEKNFLVAATLLGAVDSRILATGYAFWSTAKKYYR